MAEKIAKPGPRPTTIAYVTFGIFEDFIGECARLGLPEHLDASLTENVSTSVRAQLIPALRALALVDEQNRFTEAMRALVAATGGPGYPAALGKVLDEGYSFASHLDLETATPTRLTEAFARTGKSEGVAKRAVTFYLAASRAAGRKIGPRLQYGRPIGRGRPRRTDLGAARRVSGPRNGRVVEIQAALAQRIVDKMPDFDPGWNAADRASWFKVLQVAARVIG